MLTARQNGQTVEADRAKQELAESGVQQETNSNQGHKGFNENQAASQQEQKDEETAGNHHASYHSSLSLPAEYALASFDGPIIGHPGFALLYNEQHEQAVWVAYELTRDELEGSVSRSDKFLPDPKVGSGSAENNDYRNSGYDRGHLAPAADMKWSYASMDASFYYSNMSPQRPGFNRGIWKQAEEQVREWAKRYGALYVVTGPVLHDGLPAIGANGVSVPEYFYKVVADTSFTRAAALLIPHQSSKKPLHSFLVSIDSVEQLTGIDFFYQLPDSLEMRFETRAKAENWVWK